MADGQIFGTVRKWGHAAHAGTGATAVVQWTVPTSPDAYYHATVRVQTTSPTGAACAIWLAQALIRNDGGTISVSNEGEIDKRDGGTGYALTWDVSGGAVRVLVAAANGLRSTGQLEVSGHEQAITLA